MKLEEKDLKLVTSSLVGFSRETVVPLGYITFPMIFGIVPWNGQVMVDFVVTKVSSPYSAIIGWLTIGALGEVLSSHHMNRSSLLRMGYERDSRRLGSYKKSYIASLKQKGTEITPTCNIHPVEETEEYPKKREPVED
ncbi:hypothetical protein ACH5RR_037506 [Cinchona calisaya]|uniref:Uncharacterized protein n=1 Tax=Cinchona calisaya TaxID=153742 RepID=A0ABD2YB38_9GENT